MKGVERLILLLATMGVAVLLAGGVALAANIVGTNGPDNIVGTADIDELDGLGATTR